MNATMEPLIKLPVLLAVSDPAWRRDLALTLGEAGCDVWPVTEHDEGVAVLLASAQRLVAIVDATFYPLLGFAASDRRVADHHAFILLQASHTRVRADACQLFSCLTLWSLLAPTPAQLMHAVMLAERALGADWSLAPGLVTP